MRQRRIAVIVMAVSAAVVATLGGCGSDDDVTPLPQNTVPAGITNVVGPNVYDGVTDDLLTAGLGKTGIGGAAPTFADAANPTAAELRRRAIYTNYRGVIDPTPAGGYGRLYGPNIDLNGLDTLGEGKIPGREYLAYVDDGSGRKNVTVMVQIPNNFDRSSPCIVAGPSSGSRGVYGAIGTAGDWGLKRRCAVAYTDAGKGTGYHDLMSDKVNLIDGRLVSRASVAANQVHFAADLGGAQSTYNAQFPNRIAYKHIYSQQNPEKDWGRNVLDSVRFAFWAINQHFGDLDFLNRPLKTFNAGNTLVIASSVSNGGAESVQALEQDTEGLIDGLAVTEPNVQPSAMSGVTVNFNSAAVANAGKPLIDYFTYRMLYEPCAAISPNAQAPNGIRPGWFGFGTAPGAPLPAFTQVGGVELETIATNRCNSLAEKGLITGATTAERADAALAKMQAYGWNDPIINALHASHYRLADMYVAWGYVVAYGKFSVADNVCGFSLANVTATGDVAPQAASQAILFSTSNGLNTGGDVIYNDSVGGAKLYHLGVSASTSRMDAALDGMLCLRDLVTGVNTVSGAPLTGTALANSNRVRAGISEVLLSGNLRGKPAIIVQGRSDALVPVNHASRAYTAFNSRVEGTASNLRYYEVVNANHFDAFLPNAAGGGVQGYDALLVPLHVYFNQAMNLMWERLRNNAALPPSQVVRGVPRGGTAGSAPALTSANVPPISAPPAAGNTITTSAGTINVPN
ncbi:MAG TPA: 3-hydroxybutyrate oligomer hydrolase family protein [Burkholderiaceae bacterium]|nr:3-hydroxybutyrate oligomer hydrolase family protein [Burkholderiaceae bacterium]